VQVLEVECPCVPADLPEQGLKLAAPALLTLVRADDQDNKVPQAEDNNLEEDALALRVDPLVHKQVHILIPVMAEIQAPQALMVIMVRRAMTLMERTAAQISVPIRELILAPIPPWVTDKILAQIPALILLQTVALIWGNQQAQA
jgi:hypothetical protein